MLDKLLGSKLRASLLSWLYSHPGERYFVRQLEQVTGQDSTNISRELSRLERLGIVVSATEGKQKYYSVNERCPVFPELRGLVLKTTGLAEVLRDALSTLEGIRVAFVYGSFAEGKATPASDVDVLVIGDVGFGEVVEAFGPARQTLAREVNATVFPADEFRSKLAAGNHFLKSVRKSPKMFLIGSEDELGRLA
jgi:predicted nucleotidyltransferase